jgi:hypothetical protein
MADIKFHLYLQKNDNDFKNATWTKQIQTLEISFAMVTYWEDGRYTVQEVQEVVCCSPLNAVRFELSRFVGKRLNAHQGASKIGLHGVKPKSRCHTTICMIKVIQDTAVCTRWNRDLNHTRICCSCRILPTGRKGQLTPYQR